MSNICNISLVDVLKSSITNIVETYKHDWIITSKNEHYLSYDPSTKNLHRSKYDKVIDVNSHDFVEIFICVEGSCSLALGERVFEVNTGQVCIILPGVPHIELPIKECHYFGIWLVAHTSRTALHLSGKNTNGFFIADGFILDTQHTSVLNTLLLNMSVEVKENKSFGTELIKTYMIQILVACLRSIEPLQNSELIGSSWKDSIVTDVLNYIENNYQTPIRIDDISRQVCISSNYLNVIFKTSIGKTIARYIDDFKIEKAMGLLKTTDLSIKEISILLGYYDQYHFSNMFKRRLNFSPKQFRNKSQKDYPQQ